MKRSDCDCRFGAEKLLPCCFVLFSVITGRGELTECSKLTCFVLLPLNVQCPVVGDHDVYAVGVRAEACLEILVL